MHVWSIFVQLSVCREFSTMFWTYLLKMCIKPIQIESLDSCLGEEGEDASLGTFATHSYEI